MSAKFLEGVGGKLAEQWVANLLTPAFVFWGGGLLAYIHRHGWQPIAQAFPDGKLEALQIGILVGIFVFIYISALIVQRFDVEVLRGLEGYWYPGIRDLLQPLFQRMTHHEMQRRNRHLKCWKALNKKLKAQPPLSPLDRAALVRSDRALRHFPTQEDDFLPTRLGNLLRAAERRPYERYGLDPIICWSRLWLLLPDSAKQELQNARTQLNHSVRIITWSVLFAVWTVWAWWVLPVAIASALFAYRWILDVAEVYGDLIEAVFDLYRTALYQSLRLPLPNNPAEERAIGQQVTEYLFRGSAAATPEFTAPTGSEKK